MRMPTRDARSSSLVIVKRGMWNVGGASSFLCSTGVVERSRLTRFSTLRVAGANMASDGRCVAGEGGGQATVRFKGKRHPL